MTASALDYSGADAMTISGTFTNNSPQELLNVSIDWGDGSQPTTFSLDPRATSFQYPAQQYVRSGQYAIVVTVTDADGLSTSNSLNPLTVNYSNAAPSDLALSLDQSTITLGDQVNLSGSFSDLQTQASHTVTINWGDLVSGLPDITILPLSPGETTFQADPQTYSTASTTPYTISVTVTGLDGSTTATTSVTVSPVPDEVMIGSLVPVAWESGGKNGEFQVTRVGPTTDSLTVSYSVSGTANGTDYTIKDGTGAVLSGGVTIPAGQSSAMILVVSNDQGLTSGSPTVNVTLASGSGYSVANVFSGAQVAISDNDPGSGGPPSGPVTVQMTCFNPDGSVEGSSGSAILGDFIPIGIEVSAGNPANATYTLTYPTTITVSWTRGGADIGSGSSITLTNSYTIVYASANGSGDSGGAEPVSGDVTVTPCSIGGSGGSGGDTACSVGTDFGVLHMGMTGVTVANDMDVTPAKVQVGQQISLAIFRKAANGTETRVTTGDFTWSLPDSTAVLVGEAGTESSVGDYTKGYDPSKLNCQQVANFTSADYKQATFGSNGFYWVDPGGSKVQTIVVDPQNPQGKVTVTGLFNVQQPPLNATAQAYQNKISGFVIFRARNRAVLSVGLGVRGTPKKDGMLFSHATSPGWNYSFTQVLTQYSDDWYDLSGVLKKAFTTGPGLDSVFSMSAKSWLLPSQRSDSPVTMLGHAPNAHVVNFPGTTYWQFGATTWLMVQPQSSNSIWVPLGVVHWQFAVRLTTTGLVITALKVTPPPAFRSFAGTSKFPIWPTVIKSIDPWS